MGCRIKYPIQVSEAAFAFCRYSVVILLLLALFLQIKWLVVVVFFILLISSIFSVKYGPFVFLYTITINKIIKSKNVTLDRDAMRFSHGLGAALALICIIFLYTLDFTGWILTGIFTFLKIIGAVGYCGAQKLYTCMHSDECCAFLKRKKK